MQLTKFTLGLMAITSLGLSACGGGSSSGGGNSSDNDSTGDGGGTTPVTEVSDGIISDPAWNAGSDTLTQLIWPNNGPQTGAPLYALKKTPSSTQIIKATAEAVYSSSTEPEEDFSVLYTFSHQDFGGLEAAPFNIGQDKEHLIFSCDNSTTPATLTVWKESDFNAAPFTYSLQNTGWSIEECTQLSIGSAYTNSGNLEVSITVMGGANDGVVVPTVTLSYDIDSTLSPSYAISNASSWNAGTSLSSGYELKSVFASSDYAMLVAATEPATGKNVLIYSNNGTSTTLVDSTTNPFDQTTSEWDVSNALVGMGSNGDNLLFTLVSESSGLFTMEFNFRTNQKVSERSITSSDGGAGLCANVITGFTNSGASITTMWCQDSTDEANLLEFSASTVVPPSA